MRLKELANGSTSDMFNLPLSALAIEDGFNVRQDTPELAAHVRALADAFKAGAFIPPLVVRLAGDKALIVDGHCRFAGAKLAVAEGAAILTLPCMSVPKGTSEADRTAIMLSSGSAGLPLSPLEIAEPIKRLLAWGWSQNQIALRMGKSHQYVANVLDLAEAPAAVVAMVAAGTVSATEAVKVVRSQGEAGAVATLRRAAAAVTAKGGSRVTAKTIHAATPKAASLAPRVAVVTVPVAPVLDDRLPDAVRAFIAAWDDPDSGRVVETIAALRGLVYGATVREIAA